MQVAVFQWHITARNMLSCCPVKEARQGGSCKGLKMGKHYNGIDFTDTYAIPMPKYYSLDLQLSLICGIEDTSAIFGVYSDTECLSFSPWYLVTQLSKA